MPADFDISPVIPAVPVAPPVTSQPSMPSAVSPVAPVVMPQKSHRLLKWLIIAAVGLFVVAVGSLWFGSSSFSDTDVDVKLTAPDHATSGDELTYVVEYANNTKVPLTEMSFRFFYPEGSIVLAEGQVTKPESEGFMVDRLDPGQSGTREFKFYVVGDKGTIKAGRVHVIFKAGNLKSSFEKDISASTTILTLPVTLTLVAPPTAVSGQEVQYILDVRNDTTAELSDLKAVFTYPDGFTIQKLQPQPSAGNTTWNVARLSAGTGTRITVTGILSGNEREAKAVSVALQHAVSGQYVDYVRTEESTTISSPLLSVSVIPNGDRAYNAFPGDTLRYVISYANNSQYPFIGLVLAVKLDGDMYDLTQLRADNGFLDSGTRTVMFDSSGVPNFSNLRPGQRGTVSFSVPLKASFTGGLGGSTSFFVKATARLSTPNVPTGVDGSEVSAVDSVITKLSSRPSLSQALLYDAGAGSGPLPPQVGQETTLTVRWELKNPGNDARDVKVTATLPSGATFKGVATATLGAVPVYNSASRQITWAVGTLPFGTGAGMPAAQGQFQVSIRPSSNQQSQSVPIINAATLTGTDSFTGQAVQLRLRDYTTDSIDNHPNDGRVQ